MKFAAILVLVVLLDVSYQFDEDQNHGGSRFIGPKITKFLRSTKASDYGSTSTQQRPQQSGNAGYTNQQQSSNAGYQKSAGNDGYAKHGPDAGSDSYGDEGSSGRPYSFDWAVKDEESNNDYGHKEDSDGQVVTGSYRVLMADGRTQVVNYSVEGDSGYVATVTYEGEANTQSADSGYGKANGGYGGNQGSSSYGQGSSSGNSGSAGYGQGSSSGKSGSAGYGSSSNTGSAGYGQGSSSGKSGSAGYRQSGSQIRSATRPRTSNQARKPSNGRKY